VDKPRILVVDDEASFREFVSETLQRAGYEVMEVSESTQALDAFNEFRPDLTVLDIAMPGIDGYEVCRRIRESSEVPIVMMSAMPDQRAKMKSVHLGADDYLVKPFSMTELESSAEGLLQRSSAGEPAEEAIPAPPTPASDDPKTKTPERSLRVERQAPVPRDGEAQSAGRMDIAQFQESYSRLADNVSSIVVARDTTIPLALLGLVAGGHVLIEDVRGVGKTFLAKCIADSIDGVFTRVQGTPDLLPSEITGASVFNPQEAHFTFLPGPVFSNILLADELNRASPRTQSALLEAMAEGQVTVDGVTRPLPRPFMVIATQNTQESSGTFALPDTQLDRFMVRIGIGIPSPDREKEIVLRSRQGTPQAEIVSSIGEVLAMQEFVLQVGIADNVAAFVIEVVNFIRGHSRVQGGLSPRGTVLLMRASQGWAAIQGREFVTPDDVQSVASSVISHRVVLDDTDRSLAERIVEDALEQVPVPT